MVENDRTQFEDFVSFMCCLWHLYVGKMICNKNEENGCV